VSIQAKLEQPDQWGGKGANSNEKGIGFVEGIKKEKQLNAQ